MMLPMKVRIILSLHSMMSSGSKKMVAPSLRAIEMAYLALLSNSASNTSVRARSGRGCEGRHTGVAGLHERPVNDRADRVKELQEEHGVPEALILEVFHLARLATCGHSLSAST